MLISVICGMLAHIQTTQLQTHNPLQRTWKAFMELRYDRLSMQKIRRIENPRTFSLSESSCATRSAFNRIVHQEYVILLPSPRAQKSRNERRMTVCDFCRVQCTGADCHHSTVSRDTAKERFCAKLLMETHTSTNTHTHTHMDSNGCSVEGSLRFANSILKVHTSICCPQGLYYLRVHTHMPHTHTFSQEHAITHRFSH